MKSNNQFVSGGGWVERQTFGRPKLRLFTALACGWSVVWAVPLSMILSGETAPDAFGLTLCGLLALPQPVLVVLAVFFLLTEKPRQWTEQVRDPDYKPRNLY